ncbi:MAG: SdpA family antimicrobial peptide system protein [Gemmatimonadetes bacterium]|nr:SdpA family antimicrobial peptide system protein [Gemmatimonadota bacterium]
MPVQKPGTVGAGVLGILLLWVVVAAYSLQAVLPHNPIRLPLEREIEARRWLPEGWAFFTRSPREADVSFYALRDGDWVSLVRSPHGRPSNMFGFNRASRAQYVDAALIMTTIPADAWTGCRGTPAACLDRAKRAPKDFVSKAGHPTLCGEIGLVRQQPVPWAWAAGGKPVAMPFSVVRIAVQC